MDEQILSLANNLVSIRKYPTLLLNLEQLSPRNVISVQEKLSNKQFSILDVVLQTPGGNIDVAFNIIKIIRRHAKEVNIIVPLYAKSAGTLICLGADKILMTEISELGPLDTQIKETREGDAYTYKSALNGFKALEQVQAHALELMDTATKLLIKRTGLKMSELVRLAIDFASQTVSPLYSQLNPKTIGEYARSLEVGEKYGKVILTRYMGWGKEKADKAIKAMVWGYPSHEFILDIDELKNLGFPVETLSANEEKIACDLRMLFIDKEGDIIELLEPPEKVVQSNKKSKTRKNA